MATIKYDVSDVEAGGGGEQPQPGMYKGKIVSVTHRTQKANGDPANDLEVVVDIGGNYSRQWTYIGLNKNTAWKLREFTDAMGLKPKGEIDPKKLEGKPVSVKIAADKDLDGNYRGKIKNLFKPGSTDDVDTDGDAADSYEDWSLEDLKEEIETRGLDLPKGRATKEKLIAVLEADDETAGDDGDDGDGEESTSTNDEYDGWDESDLKEEIENRGIGGNISGRKTKAKMIEALRADDAGAGDDEEGEDTEPDDDYDDWDDDDLKTEFESRNEQGADLKISGRKTREKLLAALREDDKNAEAF